MTTYTSPADAATFAADVEAITNESRVDDLLALFAADAVAEWIMDGAYDKHEGIDAIRAASIELVSVCSELGLHVRKTVQCADAENVVLTWTGGFGGAQNQFGTEIWTLRDGLVVRQQMYSYLDVRHSDSPLASVRLLGVAPKVIASLVKYRWRNGTLRK
ncbi:nuclear transport factor 2 family protein [Gordonia sp. TBRC 11910]|uniref:Nuclear transport factor 2 family protein n=1 Tax=Gordonia asplenii TaxID=2725283 RepID=A0A848KX50_9ACTN|nr:nuclear transport factor 2 family protein [Gordonia asplenii]NMO03206.1 nuclear transport factor 2 family protein [Gordonia asplenii]